LRWGVGESTIADSEALEFSDPETVPSPENRNSTVRVVVIIFEILFPYTGYGMVLSNRTTFQ